MADGDSPPTGGKPGFDAGDAARKAAERNAGVAGGDGPDTRSGWERQADAIDKINRDAARRDARQKEADGQAARNRTNTADVSTYVPARILWPALGFPAVIAPGGADRVVPARTLCLLLLTNRDPAHVRLSKADVARHLRIVPWAQRREKRYYEPGGPESFKEEEIEVRLLDSFEKDGTRHRTTDGRVELVEIGAPGRDGREGASRFVVGLSTWVRQYYAGELEGFPIPKEKQLKHLYEVTIFEHAMQRFVPAASGGGGGSMGLIADAAAGLASALYHVFWVNVGRTDNSTHRSEEMHHLLSYYARPSRFGHDGVPPYDETVAYKDGKYKAEAQRMLSEYEFDFGKPVAGQNRTEVLHPVFVRRAGMELRIGHMTDIHLDTRTIAYAERLKNAADQTARLHFHDWNEACIKLYEESKKDADVLLMTGDLIDYGRGYRGFGPLGDNSSYWRDRNWFLFYDFLASGDKYSVPTYTSLGNHDWRINPYPPFTFGAPRPKDFALSKKELQDAYGKNHGDKVYKIALRMLGSFIYWKVQGEGRLNIPETPTETTVESVAWYLLLINPFLDYAWHLPGGYHLVVLDWANDEEVDLEVILGGQSQGRDAFPNTYGGPRAKLCPTKVQMELVEHVGRDASKCKILAMHAPPIGPWGHWKDDDLLRGRMRYNGNDLGAVIDKRGITGKRQPLLGRVLGAHPSYFDGTDNERADALYRLRGANFDDATLQAVADGVTFPAWEYPLLAIRGDYEPLGREADYGSFREEGRRWMIPVLRHAKFCLVLAGHIHRQNVLIIDTVGKDLPAEWRGKLVVRRVETDQAPAAPVPVFVNTTSAGPLGHRELAHGKYMVAASGYSFASVSPAGAINRVEFRPNVALTPRPEEPPALELPAGT